MLYLYSSILVNQIWCKVTAPILWELPLGQERSLVQKRLENLKIVTKYYDDRDLLFWAIISQRETLKSLHLKHVSFDYFEAELSPIGRFISLQELYIEHSILKYCTKINELTLHILSLEQVIAIFNNNFNELRRFSFYCMGEGFDANKLLCQMAENVPKSLETIEIRIDYDNPWIFSPSSLRKYFEEGVVKKEEEIKRLL
ncbi:11534_t:CDS:2 [Diversispora eburnea]|uniref:11534_t:CDS:1 n=1 Tax=Diversispora eburnea TaxID=1213867 RepID=A0A9N9CDG5_9GLOM|nr:11534_t:CDS:2 [Diversispora eburnea]